LHGELRQSPRVCCELVDEVFILVVRDPGRVILRTLKGYLIILEVGQHGDRLRLLRLGVVREDGHSPRFSALKGRFEKDLTAVVRFGQEVVVVFQAELVLLTINFGQFGFVLEQ